MNNELSTLANGPACSTYENLPPIYLSVRRETLLHIGIGNPDNPRDFDAIANNTMVYANDVNPPFERVISTVIPGATVEVELCQNQQPKNIPVDLQGCRVIVSGTYGALLVSQTKNVALDYYEQFLGLDQIVDYFAIGATLPPPESFDIDIDLTNGGANHPNYIGYVALQFALDNPAGDENGPGTYFFAVHPKAKIKYIHEPS
ncbi:MAG: hypothetical protein ACRCXA_03075 [Peptostreptococcaceae bacterium]